MCDRSIENHMVVGSYYPLDDHEGVFSRITANVLCFVEAETREEAETRLDEMIWANEAVDHAPVRWEIYSAENTKHGMVQMYVGMFFEDVIEDEVGTYLIGLFNDTTTDYPKFLGRVDYKFFANWEDEDEYSSQTGWFVGEQIRKEYGIK